MVDVAGKLMVFPHAVQAYTMSPFPILPGFGVYDAAVWEGEEKLARCVFDVDEVCDEEVDLLVDLRGWGFL